MSRRTSIRTLKAIASTSLSTGRPRQGMQQKLQNGGWPHLAPVGYLNVRVSGDRKAESVLAVDPEQAPLVVQAFDLYATGEHTVRSLQEEMAARGLRNKRGSPIRSKVAEMLHN